MRMGVKNKQNGACVRLFVRSFVPDGEGKYRSGRDSEKMKEKHRKRNAPVG